MIAQLRRWNIKHLAILIALLAVGFGVVGVAATVLLGIVLSPILLAPPGRRLSGSYWVVTCDPLFLLLGLYLTWFSAWAILGHIPRASLDDPKDINGLEGPFIVTALLLISRPFAFLLGCGLTIARVVHPSKSEMHWFARSYPLLIFPLIWGVGYGLLLWDPFRVFWWYMD